jgi:hypothetical protein
MKPLTLRSILAVLSVSLAALCASSSFAQDPAHPDISGIWKLTAPKPVVRTLAGKTPPLLPAAKAVYDKHLAQAEAGDRSFDGVSDCLPPGMPHIQLIDKPFQILQKPKTLYFLYQENRLPRRAYLDHQHPDVDVSFLGDSIAKWEGGTLVVDTIGLNDQTVLDASGLPHSDQLHVVERYHLAKGILEDRITIEDSKTYAAPWSTVVRYRRMPAAYHMQEEVCRAHTLQTEVLRTGGSKKTIRK